MLWRLYICRCSCGRLACTVLIFLSVVFLYQSRAFASSLNVSTPANASIYGFVGYEGGFSTKSSPSFYKSNTSYKKSSLKGKTTFDSMGQVRLGLKFNSKDRKTFGNIMMDSLPNYDFKLKLAYVKHNIGKHFSVVVGRDWSLVNQRYFRFSSFIFKPYVAGFQGSKRTMQLTFRYNRNFGSNLAIFSFGVEDRDSKNGVIVGKNIGETGKEIASANIPSFRKSVPAFVGQIQLKLKTDFGTPSTVMAYYETMPLYLECKDKERKETAYLYSLATKLNVGRVAFIGQYLHTLGMSGISGISGNALKTFSYIYENNRVIKRKSDALGAETYFTPMNGVGLTFGYVNLKFSNKKADNAYFLKNEVKNAKTLYISGVFSLTKCTKLFVIWDRIKTKYAVDNSMNGDFEQATGNQIFVGYRMYF